MDKINFIINSFKEKKIIIILISYLFDKNNITIEFKQKYEHSAIQNKLKKLRIYFLIKDWMIINFQKYVKFYIKK